MVRKLTFGKMLGSLTVLREKSSLQRGNICYQKCRISLTPLRIGGMRISSDRPCGPLIHSGSLLSLCLSLICQILLPGVILRVGFFLFDLHILLSGIINMEGNFVVLMEWVEQTLIQFGVRFGSYLVQRRWKILFGGRCMVLFHVVLRLLIDTWKFHLYAPFVLLV